MFEKYNTVLRALGINGRVGGNDYVKTKLLELCCDAANAANAHQESDSVMLEHLLTELVAKMHINTYTTTLHCINSGVVKLGRLTYAQLVYRGVSAASP